VARGDNVAVAVAVAVVEGPAVAVVGGPGGRLEGKVTGTKILLMTSEVIGEMAALRLALVAAASLMASDLETSCAAAHATASCRLLDLGEAFTMEEPSLGLSFLLPFLPMVVVAGTLLRGLKVL
jgi:hypothetical protein